MTLWATWSFPTEIRIGAGRIQELGEACLDVDIQKPLLVTDRGLADLPITKQALEILESNGLKPGLYADVDPNPTDNNLAGGVEAFCSGGHDGIVAFGGGSGLDLGKLVAFMCGQVHPVWDFEDFGNNWSRADVSAIAPIIAVPTTAGTGSEVSRAGVVLNSESHVKKIIFHPGMMPIVVICDPMLMVDLPPSIIAGAGMDAFAHCLEAYSAPSFHPMSKGIALEGMRLVAEYLPSAYQDCENIEARTQMMVAASMGAVAFQGGLGAIHAISHPIGALFNTHHGTTNAILIPNVLSMNRIAIENAIERASVYLGLKGGFDSFREFVIELNALLGIPSKLRELGVRQNRVDDIVEMALEDPSATSNPVPMTVEETRKLLYETI